MTGAVSRAVSSGALRWWLAWPAGLAGGLLLDAATPGLAWWWAAFPAVTLILAALWRQRSWDALGIGAVAGAAFWLPHISWLTLYLGPVPWLALSSLMIAWYGLFGAAASFVTRKLPGIAWPALAVAGLWVAREQLQGLVPYGGFAWGRLAHTQASGPLLQSVSWLGFAGLTGLVAFVCAAACAALFWLRDARALAPDRARRRAGVWCAGALALVVLAALVPPAPAARDGELRVAAVQGNSKSAIFDDRESGSVLADHIEATERLLDELEAQDERVDVIVWPENSAEFALGDNVLGSQRVAQLAKRADAPIVVGSILRDPGEIYTNSTLVWEADGPLEQRYDKRYPVPFAEYMPNRDFFRALAPELVDLVQLDYSAGERPAAFSIDTAAGAVRAGLAICFDIIFDQQAVAMMHDGAEVIFAQTNNADFGRTDESAQQLAIARLRAVETGRALVNISTVGTSAIVLPDGSDAASLTPFTSAAMVAEVPLTQGNTPASQWGGLIAALWCVLGAAGLAVSATSVATKLRNAAG
ncbi:apolipoprotein N-acyltransferase [Leucobacter sp. HY1908]